MPERVAGRGGKWEQLYHMICDSFNEQTTVDYEFLAFISTCACVERKSASLKQRTKGDSLLNTTSWTTE